MRTFATMTIFATLTMACHAWAMEPPSTDDDDPPTCAPSASAAPIASVAPIEPEDALAVRPPVKPARRWYGGEVLGSDAVALSLLLIGIGAASSANGSNDGLAAGLSVTSGFVYVLGGPIVHWAHGHVGAGFGSLALRVGLPFAGGLLGGLLGAAAVSGQNDGLNGLGVVLGGALVGFGVGVAAAIIVDPAVNSYEDAPAEKQAAFTVLPTFAPTKDGAMLGVVGMF
jgi:hypothetical protein